ncbi:type I 3-dehydroquinate dehydratase [Hominisplanchenecus murintestinalis]|uniref:type I 3-dehydroquinate dehydratase n=1 Tax=Hominisplanchenecus murintestinalis TaxID=2941517 RepID=UPI000EA1E3CD|nr:type I 3-dehydroquinate dehydratase [Hominisplanchenecus murintestinalis]MDE6908071.1 type I 3-dehydroquinate dehydratase [Lachnospiraceae bacterium]NBH98028.1 type I 3-dehydroquinate dehydratase [Lachnospiraceae bacterium]NBI75238.1 type I 3-dehydroquinate dehydratase [Lachnospiraceae bacterium]RKK00566.1 type I 3-dehydroquinate dehydratase [Anaerotruncus sp. 1XD22-93]
MSAIVEIRNVKIGEGTPKICVPLTASTRESICTSAEALKGHPFDMVEWRADFFEELLDPQAVNETLQELREILGDIPLLFTVRTKEEGGNVRLDAETYLGVNIRAMRTGLPDLVDAEIFRGDDITYMMVEAAHGQGMKVIASNHDFSRTPKKEELMRRLCKMQEMEADIAKLAVMPRTERDVLTLLDATLAMKELHQDTPIVTMAMGELGVISRLAGQLFGSAITFGSVGEVSAPGQIPVEKLYEFLKDLKLG